MRARGLFAAVFPAGGDPIAPHKIEILAKIANVLFRHRVGSAIAALVCRACVVTDTIQANPQVRAALMAALAPSRLPRQRPLPTALVTMTCHTPSLDLTADNSQSKKDQHSSTKLRRNPKLQAPIWARSGSRSIRTPTVPASSSILALGVWKFFGAWCLDVDVFKRVSPKHLRHTTVFSLMPSCRGRS